jgi:putative spermidine/putrescine transport system ATP-binding protein
MPQMNAPVGKEGCRVVFNKVTKSYGNTKAVHDVNLEINEGEFITLLGPSGSGKTTLLMILAGFTMPSSGTVTVDGSNVTEAPPHKRNIGMVFQGYALFPHMTVRENVAFPLQARKFARQEINARVNEALSIVKLDGLAHRYPHELSGGQQQRVALARAVVFGSPLLLMDEPFGALDRKLREHMQIELLNIKKQLKRTIVFVTHEQEEALVLSDRIVVMAEGQIQQVGTAPEIYERPENRFVADFIGLTNLIEGEITRREGSIVRFQTTSGLSLTAEIPGNRNVGGRVSVVLRPERIFLGDRASMTANRFDGRVVRQIYMGNTTQLTIALDENTLITAQTQNLGGKRSRLVGETIALGWDADQTWIV